MPFGGHTHSYENGKCECGQLDPQHEHEYQNGICECGKEEPEHIHSFGTNGKCECSEEDPNHAHQYNEGQCACGEIDLTYCTEGLIFEQYFCEECGENEYKVTTYMGTANRVFIPQTYQGLPVKTIGENAFAGDSNIKFVNLTDIVHTIENSAFAGMGKLGRINIPKGIKRIGSEAFLSCSSVEQIYFNAEECMDFVDRQYPFYDVGSQARSCVLTIGKDVKRLPAFIFRGYKDGRPNVTKLTFEENSSCEILGNNCFFWNTALKEIDFTNATKLKVLEAGALLYLQCTEVRLPDSLEVIGPDMFIVPTRVMENLYLPEGDWYMTTDPDGDFVTNGTKIPELTPAELVDFYYEHIVWPSDIYWCKDTSK